MIIKYAIEPSLLFVTWSSASKHWRGSGKMADERRERENGILLEFQNIVFMAVLGLINFFSYVATKIK